MIFFDRRKTDKRRSDKGRRKECSSQYNGPQRRMVEDRRSTQDRRSPVDRRASGYYRLSDDKKDAINRIIDLLENR